MKKSCFLTKKVVSVFLLFMIVMFTYLATPVQAADAYPYRNGSWLKADSWGFYQRECTSYACWKVRQAHGIDFNNSYRLSNGNRWGDAGNWDNAARKIRLRVDNIPVRGCIAYCDPYTHGSGKYGHVAYVYLVSGNKVYVQDYNWGGTHKYGDRMLNKTAFSGYIHFEDLQHVFYVKYNANGGKGSMANSTFTYGIGGKLRKNTFTRSGYKFNGWNIYRYSDKKWYYTKGGKTGWYQKGKQPSGYYLTIYNDQTTVKWTTSKNKDTVEMYAVWKKASNENPASSNDSLQEGVYKLKHVGTGKMMNYAWGWKEFAYKPIFLDKRDGSVEQTFRFRPVSNGKYEIDIMHKEGGVMNVWTSKTVSEGKKIGSWRRTYDDTQRFLVTYVGKNTIILRSAQNSNLAVAPDKSARGYLQLVKYNKNDKNQQWVIEK